MAGRTGRVYRTLNDLRFLRVAALLEQTLERYEEFLQGLVPYVPVRQKLGPIFAEGPGHQELKSRLHGLQEEARQRSGDVEPREALQAMLDCERFAHDFYLSALDRLSDPAVVRLFRRLADEERQHAGHVRDAMDLMSTLASARAPRARTA